MTYCVSGFVDLNSQEVERSPYVTLLFEVDSESGVFAVKRGGGLDRSPNIDGRVNYKAALTRWPCHT